jgi:hypothetical protein
MTLNRYSRPVTAAEAAGGAPVGGMVHDFYATTSADVLCIGTSFSMPVYKHPYATDYETPNPELIAMYPAVGASSFLKTPGSTFKLGGGLNSGAAEKVWGDLENNGPQAQYQFGRLTTSQTGAFEGSLFLRGQYTDYVMMPFSFALPGPGGPLSETLSVSITEQAPTPPPVYSPPDGGGVSSRSEPTPSAPAPRPKFDPFANTRPSAAGVPVSLEISRRTRPVDATELAAGVPDGYVHEFILTTSTDLIGIRDVEVDASLYQHKWGVDFRSPSAKGLAMFPGMSADSFLAMPGQVNVVPSAGNPLGNPESIWFDRTNSGALDEFVFARLTVGETGTFAGTLGVAGPTGPVFVPFSFVLPGTAADLALVEGEAPLTFTLDAALPTVQIPEPAALVLLALALPGWRAIRRSR